MIGIRYLTATLAPSASWSDKGPAVQGAVLALSQRRNVFTSFAHWHVASKRSCRARDADLISGVPPRNRRGVCQSHQEMR